MWRGLVASQASGSKSPRADSQRAQNPEAAKLDDFAAFDILRFALASAVLLGHLEVLHWAQTANLAVQVFFSLSGWLIGGILCRTEAAELGRFYFNRATRIWIPYFVTVVALYGVSLVHEAHHSARWAEFLLYDVTFTHNWFSLRPDATLALAQMPLDGTGNHFWSLAAEEQFYLLAPLIMIFVPFGKTVWPWSVIAALCYLSGSQYAAISFGVLAAVVASRCGDWQLKPRARVFLTLGLVVSIVLMYFGASAYPFGAPLFSVSAVLLCARPIRRTAISRWLGGVSFPLYLNAWVGLFAFHALQKRFGIWQGVTALELVFGVAAGALLYHAIDARVMARRNLWYRPALGWSLGVVGYSLLGTGVIFWLLKQ
jgi:peptidoglycan/LPS O-acetylase OafA/YrhL